MAAKKAYRFINDATVSATTNYTTQQLDPTEEDLHLFVKYGTYSGSGNLTFVLQHSPDNTNFFDYATTTAISSSTGSQLIVPTALYVKPEPYVRIRAVAAGGTPSLANVTAEIRVMTRTEK